MSVEIVLFLRVSNDDADDTEGDVVNRRVRGILRRVLPSEVGVTAKAETSINEPHYLPTKHKRKKKLT